MRSPGAVMRDSADEDDDPQARIGPHFYGCPATPERSRGQRDMFGPRRSTCPDRIDKPLSANDGT